MCVSSASKSQLESRAIPRRYEEQDLSEAGSFDSHNLATRECFRNSRVSTLSRRRLAIESRIVSCNGCTSKLQDGASVLRVPRLRPCCFQKASPHRSTSGRIHKKAVI